MSTSNQNNILLGMLCPKLTTMCMDILLIWHNSVFHEKLHISKLRFWESYEVGVSHYQK